MKIAEKSNKPVIVLVHGAWGDGLSWQYVIPLLEHNGYTVIAVQNPLTSLADDITTTKGVIDSQKCHVIVVAHSYGGTVITSAAADNPQVKALVYVAAFAPDSGEKISELASKYSPTFLDTALVPSSPGFLYVDSEKFREILAEDVPIEMTRVMAKMQKPTASTVFNESVNKVAWKKIPSWYLVTLDDKAVDPKLQRFMSQRMGATISEIKSSHVPFISHPKEVAKLIEEVASVVMTRC